MEQLFVREVEAEVVKVETSEDVYWETIKNMSDQGFRQVIVVEDILFSFAREVVLRGGGIDALTLYVEPIETYDPHYEAPKKSLWQRLLNREVDPAIEEAHHARYRQKSEKRHEENLKLRTKLDELTRLFHEGQGGITTVDIMEHLVGMNGDIKELSVFLGGETLHIRPNGVLEGEQTKDGQLVTLLMEQVNDYFKVEKGE